MPLLWPSALPQRGLSTSRIRPLRSLTSIILKRSQDTPTNLADTPVWSAWLKRRNDWQAGCETNHLSHEQFGSSAAGLSRWMAALSASLELSLPCTTLASPDQAEQKQNPSLSSGWPPPNCSGSLLKLLTWNS